MKRKLLWLPEALHDIERLYEFLADKNPDAAADAILCIQATARRLEQYPELGLLMDDRSERREVFAAFGAGAYVIRYRLNAEQNPVVIRVWHTRERRP